MGKRIVLTGMTPYQRLAAKLNKSGGKKSCWLWMGKDRRHGYGRINVGGVGTQTHRLAWEQANGPVPDGLKVLHKCDVKLCCNPSHLFVGTDGDNVADKVQKGRQARGEGHGNAKLTDRQRRTIRRRYKPRDGSAQRLAKLFGVTDACIRMVATGYRSAHLGD